MNPSGRKEVVIFPVIEKVNWCNRPTRKNSTGGLYTKINGKLSRKNILVSSIGFFKEEIR